MADIWFSLSGRACQHFAFFGNVPEIGKAFVNWSRFCQCDLLHVSCSFRRRGVISFKL